MANTVFPTNSNTEGRLTRQVYPAHSWFRCSTEVKRLRDRERHARSSPRRRSASVSCQSNRVILLLPQLSFFRQKQPRGAKPGDAEHVARPEGLATGREMAYKHGEVEAEQQPRLKRRGQRIRARPRGDERQKRDQAAHEDEHDGGVIEGERGQRVGRREVVQQQRGG